MENYIYVCKHALEYIIAVYEINIADRKDISAIEASQWRN